MKHARKGQIFSEVKTNKPRANTFNLSHDRKFSSFLGLLTPILNLDVIPGDRIKIKPAAMVRFAPMIAPVMHRVNVFLHYFFVPNRIVFPKWEDFITGGEDGTYPGDSTTWPHGSYNPEAYTPGTLADYMGLPVADDVIAPAGESFDVSMIPFAAYQKIYNQFYRDQNLQTPVNDELQAGLNPTNVVAELLRIKRRAWQHDYFTSCLPWTQKGPEAMLPLGTRAPIVFEPDRDGVSEPVQTRQWNTFPQVPLTGSATVQTSVIGETMGDGTNNMWTDISGSHYTDLQGATAATINELRRAFQLQEWLERNARGGSRYTESIKMHFGVNSSDGRLQRPEYIGGMKTPVKVSEVLNTSGTQNNPDNIYQPQGTMAGHAISVGGGESFQFNAEEHGYIIGIMSVMPVSAYQQGVPRHMLRDDRFLYYWPEFAHIGEQAVYNKEIAWTGDPAYNSDIFGYNPRYSEYKFVPNTVHGDYKTTLDFWHMGRKFQGEPKLNEDFIQMDHKEVERVFAVENEPHLWCQIANDIQASRLMPIFGDPKIK